MEKMGADMAGSCRHSLTALASVPLETLPADFAGAVKKSIRAFEEAFVVAVGEIRNGPTYQSLSDSQRAAMEAACLPLKLREQFNGG